MYCSKCGKHNPEGSKFCKYCGSELSVSHDPESQHISSERHSEHNAPYMYVISIQKLIIMSICTFGIYNLIWFYKQKKSFYLVHNEKHNKVYLFLDALFAPLTSYDLFKRVSKASRTVDKTNNGLQAGYLAFIYFVLSILWRLPNNYYWFGFLNVLPLISVQKAINSYWETKYKNNIKVSKFGTWNWILAVIGGLFIVLALYGTFGINDTSNSTSYTNNSNSQIKSSENQNISTDYTQSIIDINCNNQEGGSGTIIAQDGYILTNNHVIKGATSCLITLPDTTTGQPKAIYTAKPVIIPDLSQQYDLAFLSITGAYIDSNDKTWGAYPTKFPAFNFSKDCGNYRPQLGDNVRIYGYPVTSGGYNLTITDGIISSFDDNNDILTSAKIDSGNSGGLAVNKDGCFVGVPSAVIAGNYQNLGVIIPASVVGDFAGKLTTPYQSSSNASSTNQTFDTSCLSLNNPQMYGNSYYENNPTYIASLYNGCSQAVKNVVIKVNFYSEGSSIPSDTQYVDLGINYLGANDAHAINGTINTPFNTAGPFQWDAQVYSAEPY